MRHNQLNHTFLNKYAHPVVNLVNRVLASMWTMHNDEILQLLFCFASHSDMDDLFDVRQELNQASAVWRRIGFALRLKPNILDGIDTQYSSNPADCLTYTLIEWLERNYNVKKFGEPTWQVLVKAVGDPAGGANRALARKLARKHKTKDVSSKYIYHVALFAVRC